MKKIFILLTTLIFVSSCSNQKDIEKINENNLKEKEFYFKRKQECANLRVWNLINEEIFYSKLKNSCLYLEEIKEWLDIEERIKDALSWEVLFSWKCKNLGTNEYSPECMGMFNELQYELEKYKN